MAEAGLLLIRGLGHSGSTILDLALGAHSQVVGLGEAARVLARPTPEEAHKGPQKLRGDLRFERRCTCGALAADCPLWGPLLDWLPGHDDQPLEQKFNRLVQPLAAASPRWVVESFQADEQLLEARSLGRPVRVIQLTRDVRSWVHSESRRGVARHGRGAAVGWRSLLRWWRMNRRWEQLPPPQSSSGVSPGLRGVGPGAGTRPSALVHLAGTPVRAGDAAARDAFHQPHHLGQPPAV